MNTATLEEMRQKVLDRRQTLSDEVISSKSLFMDPQQPGRMIVRRPDGSREDNYAFHSRCYKQAPNVLYGLPGRYLETLVEGEKGDPALAAMNFNHWVNQNTDRQVLLRFQDVDDGEGNVVKLLRAMKPASWNPIPYEQSLETLINKFGPDHQVLVETFNDNLLVLNMIMRRLDYKTNPKIHLKRDDPVEWGCRFQDSDVGVCDLLIAPYTRRLICTNGATTITQGIVMRISHSGKNASVPLQIQSNIRQGIEMVDTYSVKVADQITASQGIALELDAETNEPDGALARLKKDNGYSLLEEKYVREAWKREGEDLPEPTVWRLHNAFTRAGSHGAELDSTAKLRLQAVGGRILELASTRYIWD